MNFKFIIDDNDLKNWTNRILEFKEMHVFVDVNVVDPDYESFEDDEL